MGAQVGNTTQARQGRSGTGSGSIGYRVLYRLGITPWDRGEMSPELVELVEGPNPLPPGRALELGVWSGQASDLPRSQGLACDRSGLCGPGPGDGPSQGR